MIFILHFSLGWNISCLGYILITYLLEAVLDGSNFPAKVTAHWHKVGLLSVQVIRIPPHIFQHLSKNVEISHKITVFQVESKRVFFKSWIRIPDPKFKKLDPKKWSKSATLDCFFPMFTCFIYLFRGPHLWSSSRSLSLPETRLQSEERSGWLHLKFILEITGNGQQLQTGHCCS